MIPLYTYLLLLDALTRYVASSEIVGHAFPVLIGYVVDALIAELRSIVLWSRACSLVVLLPYLVHQAAVIIMQSLWLEVLQNVFKLCTYLCYLCK
jgi:hypothetical protein